MKCENENMIICFSSYHPSPHCIAKYELEVDIFMGKKIKSV